MDALDAIMTRRSTRKFKAEAVEPENLKKIIEAGRVAPSGGNSRTNHFFVISDPAVLQELVALVEAAFAKMEVTENTYQSLKAAINMSKKGGFVFTYHAPILIAVANRKGYDNNLADTAVALENMMIAANALDLATCYNNQLRWLNEDTSLLEYFRKRGLKEDERIYGGIVLGAPDTPDGLPNRKSLPDKGNEVTFI
ncbi:nitroreductase family protein [Selenomonas ruminantium]|jgi:nitroreductase|uniref:Nitroreductase n=1 Tax=Selenomonas ruminantium TaxID=971 RepID=A0A1I0V3J1_SELRU|nr:nitroreductase family protein [Selenomonas ruminantium]SFA70627.1 Nitroreductase [Selenomonas ruminantium]